MATNPDQVKELAEHAIDTDGFMMDAMKNLPGESTISTDELAAHFTMMNFEQRYQLFHELLITHSTEGLGLARDVYNKAAKLFSGVDF